MTIMTMSCNFWENLCFMKYIFWFLIILTDCKCVIIHMHLVLYRRYMKFVKVSPGLIICVWDSSFFFYKKIIKNVQVGLLTFWLGLVNKLSYMCVCCIYYHLLNSFNCTFSVIVDNLHFLYV